MGLRKSSVKANWAICWPCIGLVVLPTICTAFCLLTTCFLYTAEEASVCRVFSVLAVVGIAVIAQVPHYNFEGVQDAEEPT